MTNRERDFAAGRDWLAGAPVAGSLVRRRCRAPVPFAHPGTWAMARVVVARHVARGGSNFARPAAKSLRLAATATRRSNSRNRGSQTLEIAAAQIGDRLRGCFSRPRDFASRPSHHHEVGAGQACVVVQMRQFDRAPGAIAVGVEVEVASCPVVDNPVVGIVGGRADMESVCCERAPLQAANTASSSRKT